MRELDVFSILSPIDDATSIGFLYEIPEETEAQNQQINRVASILLIKSCVRGAILGVLAYTVVDYGFDISFHPFFAPVIGAGVDFKIIIAKLTTMKLAKDVLLDKKINLNSDEGNENDNE